MNEYLRRSRETKFTAREDGDTPIIEGYFAVFGEIYEMWPGELETIAPTAFDNIAGRDIRALANHDTRIVLGRTIAGTLELNVDEHGLLGRIKINRADSDAMNLHARVLRGDVSQCSFGFDIESEEFTHQADGSVLGTIRAVTLYEVSVVTFPAYAETSVEARTMSEATRKAFNTRRLEFWKKEMKGKLNHGS